MAVSNTSLSVGAVICEVLLSAEVVTSLVGEKVRPVVAGDKMVLPYIVYRRSALSTTYSKAGVPAADSAQVEVFCYAVSYEDSIALAEAVRGALECVQHRTADSVYMRSCTLVDAEETWEDDAYVQQLTFNIKI